MLDKGKHKIILLKILKEIYSHPQLRAILGFKGGTAAFLFYQLPRLSVDLDFDLLEKDKKELVLNIMPQIIDKFGAVDEAVEKRETLFFLLSYQKGERKIKIEISKRPTKSAFEVKNYLGIPVLLMKKDDMAAHKLTALLTRKKLASRDIFDLWFFLKNDWPLNEKILKEKINLSLKQALEEAIKKVESVKNNQLLQGLGELLDQKQKNWVKNKLKQETVFFLNLYLNSLK